MRFAVLSDIHSNYAALMAVIADAESRQPDYWLFLGDYVTDCPYPHRTVEFLRDFSQTHSCLMIRGILFAVVHHRTQEGELLVRHIV